jgi:hypothetical protein
VNEVVIGLKDKDNFNSSSPSGDAQFADYVTNPVLPKFLSLIFGSASVKEPQAFPRYDLVDIFLKGVAGVNRPANVVASEELRLNTGIPATTSNLVDLGAAACFNHATCADETTCFTPGTNGTGGCDYAGWPNGRRPGDDVIDIALTTVIGYFIPDAQGANGNTILHDGVLNTHSQFDSQFPYLKTPHAGAPYTETP